MKIKIFIVMLLIISLSSIQLYADTLPDTINKSSIIIKSGVKFPDRHNYNIKYGPYLSLSYYIPISKNWGILNEIDYWKAKYNADKENEKVFSIGFGISILIELGGDEYKSKLAIGFVTEKISMKSESEEEHGPLSINFEYQLKHEIMTKTNIMIFVKQRIGTEIKLEGANSKTFTPLFCGVGIEYIL